MQATILDRVKKAINSVEPKAEIILYGSRARGDFREYSDWDFLVLVDGDVDHNRIDRIRHQLHEIEWDTGEVLCAIIRNRQVWESPRYQITPLSRNIKLEGVAL
jgi:predicted nucleotidyltransferase